MKKIIQVLLVAILVISSIGLICAEIPNVPKNATNATGCDYTNFMWDINDTTNVTDGVNITYDLHSDGSFVWGNISTDFAHYRTTSLGTHDNITAFVYAYNNTGLGNLSLTNLSLGTAVANCPVNMTGCLAPRSWEYGGTVGFDLGYTDGDNDTIAFDANNTFGTFSTTTGIFNWLVLNTTDVGTYRWSFNVTDSNTTAFTPTIGYCNSTITIIMPYSTRGGSALPVPALIGAILIWSGILFYVGRKRK